MKKFSILVLSVSAAFFFACSDGEDGQPGLNGINGADGEDGTSCFTIPKDDSTGYNVICGDKLVGSLQNGADGKDGVNGVNGSDGKDGVDGKNGADGKDGKDGAGCTMRDTVDKANALHSGVIITCGETSQVLWNGLIYENGGSNNGSGNGSDYGDNDDPVNLLALPSCDGEYDVAKNVCVGDKLYGLCGTATYDPRTEFCYEASNFIMTKCGGADYDPAIQACANGSIINDFVPIMLRDSRDGKLYKTVWIGNMHWMAENLNYAFEDGARSKCGGSTANCDAYGHVYTWSAVMDLPYIYDVPRYTNSANSVYDGPNVSEKHQGVCPKGWHVPTIGEWKQLVLLADKINGDPINNGETSLKSSEWSGTDLFGFTLLSAGYTKVSFWSTLYSAHYANNYWNPDASLVMFGSENVGISMNATSGFAFVRCVED